MVVKLNFPKAEQPRMTIGDLMTQCNTAASTMGVKNNHRNLVLNCAYAMQQLVERISTLEGELAVFKQKES